MTRRTAKYLAVLQFIDEETRLYFGRIIDREERKASTFFFAEDTERRRRALDRLFEEHNITIAHEEAKKVHPPEAALGIFKVRHSAVKFKYLIRHLGYDNCLKALKLVADRPHVILPSWPNDLGDRRIGAGSAPYRTCRKYEQPEIQAFVLGLKGASIRKKYQAFLSSTYLDLQEERQQVLRALLRCDCIPAGMELFPASDEDLWSLIRGVVDECDYYILLVGGRYGSITKEGISYTEAEYDYAAQNGRPVLAFLQIDPALSGESTEKQERLRRFREKICQAHAPAYWKAAAELPSLVQQGIEKLKRERPERGWTRAAGPSEH